MKLVIFDLDGVLVDACEWHRVALNEALKEVSNYEISLHDHYSTFNGVPTKVKLKKLAELGVISRHMCDRIYDLKQKKTMETISRLAHVRKEKIELMDYLANEGYVVACFTNCIRMTAKLMLEKTGILDKFEIILTNQDVENSKPDPEGYNMIIKKYGIHPDDCIIVEDSPKGIEAAEASGAHVMKVSSPDDVNIKSVSSFIDVLLRDRKIPNEWKDFI